MVVSTKPRSSRIFRTWLKMTWSWFEVMSQPFHLGQEMVPAAGEVPHGRGVHPIGPGDPNRHARRPSSGVEPGPLLKVLLHVEPECRVVGRIINDEDHRHGLVQPGTQVGP